MANPIVHPEAEYKIAQVGPTRDWEFSADSGKIAMKTFSIQIEGIADWVDYNQKADSEAPKPGDTIEGHVEDGGKFGYKFVKKKKAGNWGGKGGGYSAGAAWSAAIGTSANVVAGYYTASATKPKDFDEYFARVVATTKMVKTTVDELAKEAAPAETTVAVKPEAPANPDAPIVLDTVSEAELGKW